MDSLYGIITTLGENKIAGAISEQRIGSASFIRIDDPRPGMNSPELIPIDVIWSIAVTTEQAAIAHLESAAARANRTTDTAVKYLTNTHNDSELRDWLDGEPEF